MRRAIEDALYELLYDDELSLTVIRDNYCTGMTDEQDTAEALRALALALEGVAFNIENGGYE